MGTEQRVPKVSLSSQSKILEETVLNKCCRSGCIGFNKPHYCPALLCSFPTKNIWTDALTVILMRSISLETEFIHIHPHMICFYTKCSFGDLWGKCLHGVAATSFMMDHNVARGTASV